MTTITINNLTEPTALFRRYPGEHYPQPCHIYLDLEDAQLSCDYNGEIGSPVSDSVYHGRTQTWPIPPLTATSANALLAEIAPLAQRVLDGSAIEWNGSSHVAHLNADALAASDEIEAIADSWADGDDSNVVSTIDAAEWYSEGSDPAADLGLTADTTDEQLAAIEATAEAEITTAAEGTVVVEGLRTYLEGRRDEMRSVARDALEEVADQIDDLIERRASLVRQIAAWGTDSDRQIGALAGKSHTWVQNTVRAGGSE